MEILQQLLQQHGASLASQLVERLGFEPEQAARFVPAAAERLMAALQGGGLDLAGLLGGGDLSSLLGQVDVAGLAAEANVPAERASQGLAEIGPGVVDALREQAGGAEALLGALGGGSKGDLLGAASKLAGGLFGKD